MNSVPGPDHEAAPGAPVTQGKPAPPPSPYRLLGVLDPDRDQMVAFAMKVPRDWEAEQSFKRQWEGAVGHHVIQVRLRSPDGASQIEYLPAARYVYAEGPGTESLRAQQRSLGMPTQIAPNELQPMQPVAYIRQFALPYLSQNGLALRDVHHELRAAPERGENGQVLMRGSVDGRLPNGQKARVECRISVQSQQINGDTYYSWSVVPSITQTSGDLEAIHAHTRIAQESITHNPEWQQLEEEAQNRGSQANSATSQRQHQATMDQIHANTAAMTRGHEQRMNNIRQFGEANTARFNERMSQMDQNKAAFDARMNSMDRQHEYTIDTIRGESKYVDPSSGQKMKVEDGYDHVYRSRQNPDSYLGTDTPIQAGQVDWQELRKLQMKDY